MPKMKLTITIQTAASEPGQIHPRRVSHSLPPLARRLQLGLLSTGLSMAHQVGLCSN